MDRRYGLDVSNEGQEDVRLSVWGEVDVDTAPELLDAILCAAFTYDRGQVVVDLARVLYMDSTGVGALREAHRHLAADGTRLSVRNPGATLQRLLHVAGLDTYLNIESDDGQRHPDVPAGPTLRRVV